MESTICTIRNTTQFAPVFCTGIWYIQVKWSRKCSRDTLAYRKPVILHSIPTNEDYHRDKSITNRRIFTFVQPAISQYYVFFFFFFFFLGVSWPDLNLQVEVSRILFLGTVQFLLTKNTKKRTESYLFQQRNLALPVPPRRLICIRTLFIS